VVAVWWWRWRRADESGRNGWHGWAQEEHERAAEQMDAKRADALRLGGATVELMSIPQDITPLNRLIVGTTAAREGGALPASPIMPRRLIASPWTAWRGAS